MKKTPIVLIIVLLSFAATSLVFAAGPSAESSTVVTNDVVAGAQIYTVDDSYYDVESYSVIPLSVGFAFAGFAETLLKPDAYGDMKWRIGGTSSLTFLPFGVSKTSKEYRTFLKVRAAWEASENGVGSSDLVSLHPARLFYVEPDIQVDRLAPVSECVILAKAKVEGLNRPGNVFIGYITVGQRGEIYISKPRELLIEYSGFISRGYGANVAVLVADLSELVGSAKSKTNALSAGVGQSWLNSNPLTATIVGGTTNTHGETETILKPGGKFALYFVADILPVIDFSKSEKVTVSVSGSSEKEKEIRDRIEKLTDVVNNCPENSPNNVARYQLGYAYLELYEETKDGEHLDDAMLAFQQALKDRLGNVNAAFEKDAHFRLAWIWHAKLAREAHPERGGKKAEKFKANISRHLKLAGMDPDNFSVFQH